MSKLEEAMTRTISCWAKADRRAKHLCAFETLGLNIRCRKPSQAEVKKAWHRLCVSFHPDRNVDCDALATEATRCINLAKQHLFEVHFGGASARVQFKHEADREEAIARAAADMKAAAEAAEAAEVATEAAQRARLVHEHVTEAALDELKSCNQSTDGIAAHSVASKDALQGENNEVSEEELRACKRQRKMGSEPRLKSTVEVASPV